MYTTGSEIVSPSTISLRSPSTLNHAFWHCHHLHRSSHREWFALASHSFSTPVLQLLPHIFVRYLPVYPYYPSIHDTQLLPLELQDLHLKGLTSTVCGKYCRLFAIYMDRGYTAEQFIGLFESDITERQIEQMFTSEFGPLCRETRGEQYNSNMNKRYVTTHDSFIIYFYID